MSRFRRHWSVKVRLTSTAKLDVAAYDETEAKERAAAIVRKWRDVVSATAEQAQEVDV